MARPLLTEALADMALDAKCALEDGQARIVRAVAERELSVTTGREIMALLLRLVELNDEIHRHANAVHMAQRIADIGARGGFVTPTPAIRRRLAEGGLAVIGCENVSELHPDEDQAA